MRQILIKREPFFGILKTNFHLAIRNNLLLAALYLRMIPVLRGVSNLDEARSAECLGQSVAFIGILLIVPLRVPEQEMAIREVVFTRKVAQWKILLIRFFMAAVTLIVLTGIFAGVMALENCTFPYAQYVFKTVASELVLGSVGFLAAALANSAIVGYLASIGYFLLHDLGI